jgi:hypothetical protein
LAHDFGWFLLQSGVFLPLNGLVLVHLDLLYAAYLASWSVSVPAETSAPVRFVLAVLWSDFLEWSATSSATRCRGSGISTASITLSAP